MSSFIWFELVSKNCVWKFLRFSLRMGFSILRVGLGICDVILSISVLDGMCSCIGRWSELRWISWFVVEVY